MASRSGVTVAVIGASGNVGRKIIELLISRGVVVPAHLQLFASTQSAGKSILIADQTWLVNDAATIRYDEIDVLVLATEAEVSSQFIQKALNAGVVVVDSSSLHRLDKDVPLVVGPVNSNQIAINDHKLYAIANCISSPISTVISPLHAKHPVKRLVISTYQSVSGAGKTAMDALRLETEARLQRKAYQQNAFNRSIGFNVIPDIGGLMEDGMSKEEYKIMHELQKILETNVGVAVTSVRVPVLVGHSVSLAAEFDDEIDVKAVQQILAESPGVTLVSDYKTPVEIEGSDDVFVGRVRKDTSVAHGIQMWLCSDNLRRGAATDAVEVVEAIVQQIKEGK